MASNETVGDLAALAQAVRERRNELDLTQVEVVAAAGPGLSKSSLFRIESARDPDVAVSRQTLRALDEGLEWPAGQARAIYRGAATPSESQPEQIDDDAVATVIAAIENDPNLLPEAKRHLISQYGLLLRVTPRPTSADADRNEPHLKAVARKGTPRRRRGSEDGGGGT